MQLAQVPLRGQRSALCKGPYLLCAPCLGHACRYCDTHADTAEKPKRSDAWWVVAVGLCGYGSVGGQVHIYIREKKKEREKGRQSPNQNPHRTTNPQQTTNPKPYSNPKPNPHRTTNPRQTASQKPHPSPNPKPDQSTTGWVHPAGVRVSELVHLGDKAKTRDWRVNFGIAQSGATLIARTELREALQCLRSVRHGPTAPLLFANHGGVRLCWHATTDGKEVAAHLEARSSWTTWIHTGHPRGSTWCRWRHRLVLSTA